MGESNFIHGLSTAQRTGTLTSTLFKGQLCIYLCVYTFIYFFILGMLHWPRSPVQWIQVGKVSIPVYTFSLFIMCHLPSVDFRILYSLFSIVTRMHLSVCMCLIYQRFFSSDTLICKFIIFVNLGIFWATVSFFLMPWKHSFICFRLNARITKEGRISLNTFSAPLFLSFNFCLFFPLSSLWCTVFVAMKSS